MTDVALSYAVVAWLGVWLVDLTILILTRPLFAEAVAKFIIVLLCLLIVMVRLWRARWLLW